MASMGGGAGGEERGAGGKAGADGRQAPSAGMARSVAPVGTAPSSSSLNGGGGGGVELTALAQAHHAIQYPIWLPPAQYADPTRHEAGPHMSKADLLTGKQHRNRLRDTQLYLSAEMLEWTKHTLKRNIMAPDVFTAFANGELLCALLNTICPPSPPLPISFGAAVKSPETRSHVAHFLRMASRLGVASHNLFKPKDLIKRANERRVMRTLLYLSLALLKYGARPLPCLEEKIRTMCAATGYALPEVMTIDAAGAGANAGAATGASAPTNSLGRFGSGYVLPATGAFGTSDSANSSPVGRAAADSAESAAAERRRRQLEASADFRPKLHFLGGGAGQRRRKPLLPSSTAAGGGGFGSGSHHGYVSTAGDMFQPTRASSAAFSSSPAASSAWGPGSGTAASASSSQHNPNATNVSPARPADRFGNVHVSAFDDAGMAADPMRKHALLRRASSSSGGDSGSGASTPAAPLSSSGAAASASASAAPGGSLAAPGAPANLGLSNIGILSHDAHGMPLPSFPHPAGERFESALQNLDLGDLLQAATDETDIDAPNMASLLFPAFVPSSSSSAAGVTAASGDASSAAAAAGGAAASLAPSPAGGGGGHWQRDGAALHARVDPLKFSMWSSRHPFYSLLLSLSLVLLCIIVLFGAYSDGPFVLDMGAAGFHRKGDEFVRNDATWKASVQNSWAFAQVQRTDINFGTAASVAVVTTMAQPSGIGSVRTLARSGRSEGASGSDSAADIDVDAASPSSSSAFDALVTELHTSANPHSSTHANISYADAFLAHMLDGAADGFDFDAGWRARFAAKLAQRRQMRATQAAADSKSQGDGHGVGPGARQLLQSSDDGSSDSDAPYPAGTPERSVLGASLSLLFILQDDDTGQPSLLTPAWLRRLREFEVSLLTQPTYRRFCLRPAGPSTALSPSLFASAPDASAADQQAEAVALRTGRFTHCEFPDSANNYYFARVDADAQVAFMDGANFTASSLSATLQASLAQNISTINRLLHSWGRVGFFDRAFDVEAASASSASSPLSSGAGAGQARSAHMLSTFSFGTPLPEASVQGASGWSRAEQQEWLEEAVLDAYIDQVEGRALGPPSRLLPGEEEQEGNRRSSGTVLLALDGPGVQSRILSRIIFRHDLPLIAGALILVLLWSLSHFRSLAISLGVLVQVVLAFLVTAAVVRVAFGLETLFIVHVVVLFVGLGLGMQDAFVIFDCFSLSGLLRLRVELPLDRAVRKAREAREAYEARQVDPSFRGHLRRLWWDETRCHEALLWVRNNLIPCATVTDYELAAHFEVGLAHSNPLAPAAPGGAPGGIAAASMGALGGARVAAESRRARAQRARNGGGAGGAAAAGVRGSRSGRNKGKGFLSSFTFGLLGGNSHPRRGRARGGQSRSSTPTRLAPDSDDDIPSSFFESPRAQSMLVAAQQAGQNMSALSVLSSANGGHASASHGPSHHQPSPHHHRRLGSQDFNPPALLPGDEGASASPRHAHENGQWATAATAAASAPTALGSGEGAAAGSSPSGPRRIVDDGHEAALASSDEVGPPFASAGAGGVGAGAGMGGVRSQGSMLRSDASGASGDAPPGPDEVISDAHARERDREREAQRERVRTQRVLAAIASLDDGHADEDEDGEEAANLEAMASRSRHGADALRSAIRRKQADRLALRLSWSLRRAAPAMLTTNLTVVVALYAIALSPILPIKSFGLWAGTLALINSLMSLTLFPTLLVLQHIYMRHVRLMPECVWRSVRNCMQSLSDVADVIGGEQKYQRALELQQQAAQPQPATGTEATGDGDLGPSTAAGAEAGTGAGSVDEYTHTHAFKSGAGEGGGGASHRFPRPASLHTVSVGSPPSTHRVNVSVSIGMRTAAAVAAAGAGAGDGGASPRLADGVFGSGEAGGGDSPYQDGSNSPVVVGGVNITKAPWTPHSRAEHLGDRTGGAAPGEESKHSSHARSHSSPAGSAGTGGRAASSAAVTPAAPLPEGTLVKKRLVTNAGTAGLARDSERLRASQSLERSRRNHFALFLNGLVYRVRFPLLIGWTAILALCIYAAVQLDTPQRILTILPPGSNLELLRDAYAQMPPCGGAGGGGAGAGVATCTYDYARVERQVIPWASGAVPVTNSDAQVREVSTAAMGGTTRVSPLAVKKKKEGREGAQGKERNEGRKMHVQAVSADADGISAAHASASAAATTDASLALLLSSPFPPTVLPPPSGADLPLATLALPSSEDWLAEQEAEMVTQRRGGASHRREVGRSRREMQAHKQTPQSMAPPSLLKNARRLKVTQQQQQQQQQLASFSLSSLSSPGFLASSAASAASLSSSSSSDFFSLSLVAPSPPPLLLMTEVGYDSVRVVFAQSVYAGISGTVESYLLVMEPVDSEEEAEEGEEAETDVSKDRQFSSGVPSFSQCSSASSSPGAVVKRLSVVLRPPLSHRSLSPLAPCVTSTNVSCAMSGGSPSSPASPLAAFIAPVTLGADWFATATIRGGSSGAGIGVTSYASGSVVQDMRGFRPGTLYRATIRARSSSAGAGASAGAASSSSPSVAKLFRTLDATPPAPVLLRATAVLSTSDALDPRTNVSSNPRYELRVRVRLNYPEGQMPRPVSFRVHWEADVEPSAAAALAPLPPDGSVSWADVPFPPASNSSSPDSCPGSGSALTLANCELDLTPIATTQLRGGLGVRVWLTTANAYARSATSNLVRLSSSTAADATPVSVPIARPYAPVVLGYAFLIAPPPTSTFLTPVLRVYFVPLATNQDASSPSTLPDAVELVWNRLNPSSGAAAPESVSNPLPWSSLSVALASDSALPVGALVRPAGLANTHPVWQADFGAGQGAVIEPNSLNRIMLRVLVTPVAGSEPVRSHRSVALLAASHNVPLDPPQWISMSYTPSAGAGTTGGSLTVKWDDPIPSSLHPNPSYLSYTVFLSAPGPHPPASTDTDPPLTAFPIAQEGHAAPGRSATLAVDQNKQYYVAISLAASYGRSERTVVECVRTAPVATTPGARAHPLSSGGSLSQCDTVGWNQLCVASYGSSAANCAGGVAGGNGSRVPISMRRPVRDHMVMFESIPSTVAAAAAGSLSPTFTRRFVLSNPNGTLALHLDSVSAAPLTPLSTFFAPRRLLRSGVRVPCMRQTGLGYDPWGPGGGAVDPWCFAPCNGASCVPSLGAATGAGPAAATETTSLCSSVVLSMQRLTRTTTTSSSSLSVSRGPRIDVGAGMASAGGNLPFTASRAALGQWASVPAGSGPFDESGPSGPLPWTPSTRSQTQLVMEVTPSPDLSPGVYSCAFTFGARLTTPTGAVANLDRVDQGGPPIDPDIVLSLRVLPRDDLPAPVREVEYGVVASVAAAAAAASSTAASSTANATTMVPSSTPSSSGSMGGKNISFVVPYAPPGPGNSICSFHLRYATEAAPTVSHDLFLDAWGVEEGETVSALLPSSAAGGFSPEDPIVFSVRALNARGFGADFESEWRTSDCTSTSIIPADPSEPAGATMYGLGGCAGRGSCRTPTYLRRAQAKPWGVTGGADADSGATLYPILSSLVSHDVATASSASSSPLSKPLQTGSFQCRCKSGWFGPGCASVCPATMPLFRDGDSGAVIPAPPLFDSTCTGQGMCHASNHSCACTQGMGGLACQLQCPDACSGRGECVLAVSDSSSSSSPPGVECRCPEGWGGPSCAMQCSRAPGAPDSAPPCSGRGSCNSQLACVCVEGFRGYACHLPCPGSYRTSNGTARVCNGRGRCMQTGTTDDDTRLWCQCDNPADKSDSCTMASAAAGADESTLENKYYSALFPAVPRLPSFAFPAVHVTWGVRGVRAPQGGAAGTGDAGVAAELAAEGGASSSTLSASASRAAGTPIYSRSFDATARSSQLFFAAACDVLFASGLVHESHTPGCIMSSFVSWNTRKLPAPNAGATGEFPLVPEQFTQAFLAFLDSIPAEDPRAPWKQHVGFVFQSSPFERSGSSSGGRSANALARGVARMGDDSSSDADYVRVQGASERFRLLRHSSAHFASSTPAVKADWLASLLGSIATGWNAGNSSSVRASSAAEGEAAEAEDADAPVLLSYDQLHYLRNHAAHGSAFQLRFDATSNDQQEESGDADVAAASSSSTTSPSLVRRRSRPLSDASPPVSTLYVRIASLSFSFLGTFDPSTTSNPTQRRYADAWTDLVEGHINPRAPATAGPAFHSSATWARMSRQMDFANGVTSGFVLMFVMIFLAIVVATGARLVLSLLVILSLLGVVVLVFALLVGGGMSLGAVEYLTTQVVLALSVPPLVYLGSAYAASPFGSRFGRARQALLQWGGALFSAAICMCLCGLLLLFARLAVLSNAGAILAAMSVVMPLFVLTFYLPLLQCVGPMGRDQRAARKEQRRVRREREAQEQEVEEEEAAAAAAVAALNAAAAATQAARTATTAAAAAGAPESHPAAPGPDAAPDAAGASRGSGIGSSGPRGLSLSQGRGANASSQPPSHVSGLAPISARTHDLPAGSTPDFIQPSLAVLTDREREKEREREGGEESRPITATVSKRVTQTFEGRHEMLVATTGLRNGGGFGSARTAQPSPTPPPQPTSGVEGSAPSNAAPAPAAAAAIVPSPLSVRIHPPPFVGSATTAAPSPSDAVAPSLSGRRKASSLPASSLPASPSGADWPSSPTPSSSTSTSSSAVPAQSKRAALASVPRPLAALAPLKGRPFGAGAGPSTAAAAGRALSPSPSSPLPSPSAASSDGPTARSSASTRPLWPLHGREGSGNLESPVGSEYVETPSFPADERRGGGGGGTRPSSFDWDASVESVGAYSGDNTSPAHRVSAPLSVGPADGSGRKKNRIGRSPQKAHVRAQSHFDDENDDGGGGEGAQHGRGRDASDPAPATASARLQPAAPMIVSVHLDGAGGAGGGAGGLGKQVQLSALSSRSAAGAPASPSVALADSDDNDWDREDDAPVPSRMQHAAAAAKAPHLAPQQSPLSPSPSLSNSRVPLASPGAVAPLAVSMPLRTLGARPLASKLPLPPVSRAPLGASASASTVAAQASRPLVRPPPAVVPSAFDDDDSLELDIEEMAPGGVRVAGAATAATGSKAEEEVVEVEHDWDD